MIHSKDLTFTGFRLMNAIIKVEQAFSQYGIIKGIINRSLRRKRKEFYRIMNDAAILLDRGQLADVEEKIKMLEAVESFLITDV